MSLGTEPFAYGEDPGGLSAQNCRQVGPLPRAAGIDLAPRRAHEPLKVARKPSSTTKSYFSSGTGPAASSACPGQREPAVG